MKQKKCDNRVWDDIEENMKNPEYVRAAYEFILKSIS